MMETRFADPVSQAFLHFWVGIHGDSALAQYLRPLELPPVEAPPERLVDVYGFELPRRAEKNITYGVRRRPEPAKIGAASRRRAATGGMERRQDRIEKRERAKHAALVNTPLAEWAQRLIGDATIANITLFDVIDGIEHYFEILGQMRKFDPDAYAYFSRVGTPLTFYHGSYAAAKDLWIPRFPNAQKLPHIFGTFIGTPKAEYRRDVLEDRKVVPEFMYYSRIKTHRAAAPLGATVFAHRASFLRRDNVFSEEELRRHPSETQNWGWGAYIGILEDGSIKALPMHMCQDQKLPRPQRRAADGSRRGDWITHSGFRIPRFLKDLGDGDAHWGARNYFAITMAFTLSALKGLQVTVRRGKQVARFGIPIDAAKDFFADRDADGRRKPILHLMRPFQRELKDGRVVTVGEHLRGERQFTWRGYEITVGAAGLHYPSPEGFAADAYDLETLRPDELPDRKLVPTTVMARKMAPVLWWKTKPSFKGGEPVGPRLESSLEPEPEAYIGQDEVRRRFEQDWTTKAPTPLESA